MKEFENMGNQMPLHGASIYAQLEKRLKVYANTKNINLNTALNLVVLKGLEVLEKEL